MNVDCWAVMFVDDGLLRRAANRHQRAGRNGWMARERVGWTSISLRGSEERGES